MGKARAFADIQSPCPNCETNFHYVGQAKSGKAYIYECNCTYKNRGKKKVQVRMPDKPPIAYHEAFIDNEMFALNTEVYSLDSNEILQAIEATASLKRIVINRLLVLEKRLSQLTPDQRCRSDILCINCRTPFTYTGLKRVGKVKYECNGCKRSIVISDSFFGE